MTAAAQEATRNHGRLAGLTYDCPDGGRVRFPTVSEWREGSRTAGVGAATSHGVGVGPLQFSAYPESTAVIDAIQFTEPSNEWFDGWGSDDTNSTDGDGGAFWSSLAGLGVAGVASDPPRERDDPSETRSTRRDILRVLGAGTALSGAAARATAQSDTVTTAAWTLAENPGGLRVQVLDRVSSLLPVDQQYYALIEGMDYATFSGGPGDSADIPPKVTGAAEVNTDVGFLDDIKTTFGDKAVTYEWELEASPADVSEGTPIEVTSHPFVVDAVLASGADATALAIAGEAIPHVEEDAQAEIGTYRVRDGDVIYRVGQEIPPGTRAEMTIYAGVMGELENDIGQVV
jgi:hypothetical protein